MNDLIRSNHTTVRKPSAFDYISAHQSDRELMTNPPYTVLDIWPMSVKRPEAHLNPPLDCLHFCEPSLQDYWQKVRLITYLGSSVVHVGFGTSCYGNNSCWKRGMMIIMIICRAYLSFTDKQVKMQSSLWVVSITHVIGPTNALQQIVSRASRTECPYKSVYHHLGRINVCGFCNQFPESVMNTLVQRRRKSCEATEEVKQTNRNNGRFSEGNVFPIFTPKQNMRLQQSKNDIPSPMPRTTQSRRLVI